MLNIVRIVHLARPRHVTQRVNASAPRGPRGPRGA
jgi:hypothetical protein